MVQSSLRNILLSFRSTLAPSSCSSSWRIIVMSCCWHLSTAPPQGGRMIWSWCHWFCSAWIPCARGISGLSASVALWLPCATVEVYIRAKFCAEIKQRGAATPCKGTANSFQPFQSFIEVKKAAQLLPHFAPYVDRCGWETSPGFLTGSLDHLWRMYWSDQIWSAASLLLVNSADQMWGYTGVCMGGWWWGRKAETCMASLMARPKLFLQWQVFQTLNQKSEYFHACFYHRMLAGHFLMSGQSQLIWCKLSLSATQRCLSGDLFHIKTLASALSDPTRNIG